MKIYALGFTLLIGLVWASPYPDQSEEQEPGVANCQCGYTVTKKKLKGRVVGGKTALLNEYPLIGALTYADDATEVFCGSTIITERHAISAAHCKPKTDRAVNIVLGDHDVESTTETKTVTIAVEQFVTHEYFNDGGHKENDIALLVLAEKIPFGPTIGPACFPKEQLRLTGKTVRIIGWGALYYDGPQSRYLQKVDVAVKNLAACTATYRGVSRRQLCTYSSDKDACQGDSGGPVIYREPSSRRYTIVGIVSYGAGCAEPDTPAVNTNVIAYRDWILRKIHETVPTANVCQS